MISVHWRPSDLGAPPDVALSGCLNLTASRRRPGKILPLCCFCCEQNTRNSSESDPQIFTHSSHHCTHTRTSLLRSHQNWELSPFSPINRFLCTVVVIIILGNLVWSIAQVFCSQDKSKIIQSRCSQRRPTGTPAAWLRVGGFLKLTFSSYRMSSVLMTL